MITIKVIYWNVLKTKIKINDLKNNTKVAWKMKLLKNAKNFTQIAHVKVDLYFKRISPKITYPFSHCCIMKWGSSKFRSWIFVFQMLSNHLICLKPSFVSSIVKGCKSNRSSISNPKVLFTFRIFVFRIG